MFFFFFVLDFIKSKFCPLSTPQMVFPFLAIDTEVDGFFVLKQVCLMAVDITGYSDSPPPSLHSSDTKYGVRKSAHGLGGKSRIPQKRKNSTTMPGLFREVLKGKAFPFTIIVHVYLMNEGLERFMC